MIWLYILRSFMWPLHVSHHYKLIFYIWFFLVFFLHPRKIYITLQVLFPFSSPLLSSSFPNFLSPQPIHWYPETTSRINLCSLQSASFRYFVSAMGSFRLCVILKPCFCLSWEPGLSWFPLFQLNCSYIGGTQESWELLSTLHPATFTKMPATAFVQGLRYQPAHLRPLDPWIKNTTLSLIILEFAY